MILSTNDTAKLLQQFKSGLKRTINWNTYKSKATTKKQNQYLDYLIDPSFQGVKRLFVLSSENNADRNEYIGWFIPKVEIKDYNAVIDGKSLFDLGANDKIRKVITGQGDDYTTGCLLDYPYFKETSKLITIDLSKQQKLDANPKEMHKLILLEI